MATGEHVIWWTILAALSGWSYVTVWSANAASLAGFYPNHFAGWVAVLLCLGLAVTGTAYLLSPSPARWDRSYAIGAFTLVTAQSWDRVLLFVDRLSTEIGAVAAVTASVSIVVIVVALILRLVPLFPITRAVLGVLTVFLVGFHFLTVAQHAIGEITSTSPPSPTTANVPDGWTASDVLVLVLDGYGRSDVLRESFGHDNSGFEERLARNGVNVVPKAKANYTSTALSVGGLLDGRYLAIGDQGDARLEDLHEIHSGDAALFRSLDAAGYETHLFDNAWTLSNCRSNVDVCHSSTFNEIDASVIQRTPLRHLPALSLEPWVSGSLDQLQQAADLARSQTSHRRLIYVHSLIPHEPFRLDANCDALPASRSNSIEGAENTSETRRLYIGQLQCVNSLVADLIEAMPDESLIFITGDHGPRWSGLDPIANPGASDTEIVNRIGIFTAYRFPPECAVIPEDASLMGSAARLYACLGIPYDGDPARDPSQPERYFSPLVVEGAVNVTDMTSLVSHIP